MPSEGTVREWNDDEGWGVIDSPGTPGGCWAHFSVIVAEGYRSLTPGDQVVFTHEAPGQDGFGYRALQVWPPGGSPDPPPSPSSDEPSAAYQSTLTIRWAGGRVTRGLPGEGQEPR